MKDTFNELYEEIMNEAVKSKKYKVSYIADWQDKEKLGGMEYTGGQKLAFQQVKNKVTIYRSGKVETFEFDDIKQANNKMKELNRMVK